MSRLTPEHRAGFTRATLAAIAGALVAAQLIAPGGLGYVSLLALVLASLAALAVLGTWHRIAERIGPRHVLDLALPFSALILVVLSVRAPLGLPAELTLLTTPLLFASLALAWLGTRRAPGAGGLRGQLLDAAGAVSGAIAFAGLATWLPGATPLGYLALAAGALSAFRLMGPVEDPIHPGPSPLTPYVPWGEREARGWPAWHRLPLRAPATLLYLVASWALFLWLGEPEPGGWGLDTTRYADWLYHIPDLSQAPLDATTSLVTAVLLNHDHVQLIYVTVLLALFGLPFEVQEGTPRWGIIFTATGLAGALVAGLVLHLAVAGWSGVALLEHAWQRTWSGGSVGAFGLMGALAARASRPAPLFGFFVFWELNVGAWFLRSYTPVFHLTALATGYLLARHVLDEPA